MWLYIDTDIVVVVQTSDMYFNLYIAGGNCWAGMNKNGRCSVLYTLGTTKEECCGSGSLANSVSASFSEGVLSSSSIFRMHLQGGVPCTRCKGTFCTNS